MPFFNPGQNNIIVLSPPRQLIMLAQADNAPSVERQLYNYKKSN